MQFSKSQLEAFLDEGLPSEEMARIEQAMRGDLNLRRELAEIHARRDAGVHSLAEVWRRHRLACPSREQLSSYLLGTLDDELARFIGLHVTQVGCRYCQANLEDLGREQAAADHAAPVRRKKIFQSSAGRLPKAPR